MDINDRRERLALQLQRAQQAEKDEQTRQLKRLQELDEQAQKHLGLLVALTAEHKVVQKEVHEATVQKLQRTEALLLKRTQALLKTMQVCLSL